MPATIRMDPAGAEPIGSELKIGDEAPTEPALRRGEAHRCPACGQVFSGDARFCPFDGDTLEPAPDWNPSADGLLGRIVAGRYEVLSVLGEGGMGTIYEVRHTALDRRFALKVLRRDIAADQQLVARFIREAKAAAAIGHPNIVAVSDFGELTSDEVPGGTRAGAPYFVMEHLVGGSLAAALRRERTMDVSRAARIFVQCARALQAAHGAGVVHRDLKPDNIFLVGTSGREIVKLLDFGVAKIAGAGRLTRAGMVFGTPHYMSPEQAGGHVVDHRADIYALGVVMYECFAGRVPFESDTYMGVLTMHLFAAPEPIDRVAPEPERLGALASIIMRCLSKNALDRFACMEDVADAIEDALRLRSDRPSQRHQPIASEAPKLQLRAPESLPAPPGTLLPFRWGRTRAAVLGSILGSAAALSVAIAALWLGATKGRAPSTAENASSPAPPSSAPAATASAPIPSATSDIGSASPPEPTAPSGAPPSVTSPTSPTKRGPTRPTAAPAQPRPPKPPGELVDPWAR